MPRSLIVFLISALLLRAKDPTLAESLVQHRYSLTVQDGRFVGSGAAVLKQSIENAQFVLVGEDHGISQIPEFIGGLCQIAGPIGFHTMAVETGPIVASQLERWAVAPDRNAQAALFESTYPFSIAFYNWQQELDALAHCAESAKPEPFQIWGLDQELMGSAGLILTRILETHPGPHATVETQRLIQRNADAYSKAKQTGNPFDLFLQAGSIDEFKNLQALLRVEGNSTAQVLIDSLLESRSIYQGNHDAAYYTSNRQRAQLMKRLFVADYQKAIASGAKPPKVFFKFGGNHMYRGLNPMQSSEVGNYVAELAEGQGRPSLHIMILGVNGKQLRFNGIGKPGSAASFDMSAEKSPFLKPMFDNLAGTGWTMFDLQPLRADFGSFGKLDGEMERLIFGYDYLVLIPEATASTSIQ